ncbi:flagellin [Luteimonas wenzhouensis]|uniref:Flagellin n=1 Tax=Luteimonas wenzhouensis TaxID=2599615 RepID=A0A5C5TXB9_9GAMM|nr:flagellin [Luteimonas wenzhouensis]TWT18038.1 flagellin [Luteimonas wenzhouensis]
MSTVINTNVMSLNAQRNLTASGADLATSLQRLSSGMRINSAKDDAAGLAISQRFTTQIRGLDQAARNANDGISLAQTAEGALAEIGNNLQRIRELAVQSRNATNSASDREALDAEVQQLKAEIQRVAETTNFNDVKLLDGSFQAQSFQVGANQGETIDIAAIVNANIDALGTWTSVGTGYSQTLDAFTATDPEAAASVTINGVTINVADEVDRDGDGFVAALKAAFDAAKANPANTALANVEMSAAGVLSTTDADITLANLTNLTGPAAGTTQSTETQVPGSGQTGFATLDIKTVDGADNMILAMDAALKDINTARANMGAVQNRFTSVIANLSTSIENLSAARSRIQDADFAKESAQLSRNQILQQAGTAMLAQANQATQNVLQLLR